MLCPLHALYPCSIAVSALGTRSELLRLSSISKEQLLCFLTSECDLQAMMAGNLTCSQLVSSYIQVDFAMSICSGKQDEQSHI